MSDVREKRRLADTLTGRILALLLAVGWVIVMACVDTQAYTAFPLCLIGAAACLLGCFGLLRGDKMVCFSPVNWLAAAVWLYFLVRALCSYSVVEGWGQAALLLACAVYYVAGVTAAQGSGRMVIAALALALVANIAYFGLMRLPESSVLWSGRPECGLTGPNSRPVGLFFYGNFAGFFFMTVGALLLYAALASEKRGWRTLLLLLPALGGIALSFFCDTLSTYISAALLLLVGWVIFCLNRAVAGRRPGFAIILISAALVAGFAVAVYGFLSGGLFEWLSNDLDSHLRYEIWGDLTGHLGEAGACGLGAGASQWAILTSFRDWSAPNFAHNEFLQAWVDYGLIGALLVLLFLVSHLSAGLLALGSDAISSSRRRLTGMALLYVTAMALCAFYDYYWHHAALAASMAFACGVMASPCRRRPLFLRPRRVWMDGRHEALLDVRAARPAERAALILLSLAALGAFVWLGGHFAGPWMAQWSIGSAESRERGAAERCRVLRSLARDYPDYALLNECVRLDPVMEKSLNETIAAMSLTLEANPKNLYNVSMLAHLLARAGRYDEAELIQRRFYEGDGPPPSQIGAWYAVYGRNLLLWGYDDFKKGRHASGLSKMHYAMRMHAHASLHAQTLHRADRTWTVSWRRQEDMEFLRRCKQCVRLRTLMGMPEDDSWSRPLEPGGKPSLYRRWGLNDANN
ncbi:MAG TPA: hypothetical protein H9862_05250 [Candidatus Akkermansia intestinigallinarum]|uniref:O-antigen ligase family protein n=1 Tax=Candidatus Akkermansia intestinigallinarum TaxID=2838431 RepID=A0A9D1VBZ6_9BACT|nr:hypothetical protein [Candidatus Akkermansia intestinigallinarum]